MINYLKITANTLAHTHAHTHLICIHESSFSVLALIRTYVFIYVLISCTYSILHNMYVGEQTDDDKYVL